MSQAEVQERDAGQLVEQLNRLVSELELYPDAEAREKALDLVQLIVELYGEALRRIMATFDSLPLKDEVLSRMVGDEFIRTLLLIHGLLPIALHEQIEAIERAPSGTMIAPARNEGQQPARLVQIRGRQAERKDAGGTWVSLVRALGFADGQQRIVNHADVNLLVCKIGGEFFAYRNACVAGNRGLDDALFVSPMLTCSCHGYRYDLRRAGACIDQPELRLEALPVRVEDDKVKAFLPQWFHNGPDQS